MNRRLFSRPVMVLLAMIFTAAPVPVTAMAQEGAEEVGDGPAGNIAVEEIVRETEHSVRIGGENIRYTARAGTMIVPKSEDGPEGSFFYIAYDRTGAGDPSERPITFVFNGGPGSSSVWLHLGLAGPRRVLMRDDGSCYPPPYRLVDNEYSILDETDLVFIDPVSTGFSRAVSKEDEKKFHGLNEDISSVGEFIRLYLARNARMASPKFIMGESYGTTRAAGLSSYLQNRHGLFLNGIVLISSILHFQTTDFDAGNDLPYILFLPTYTATAWYHGKLGPEFDGDLKKALKESQQFAIGEYSSALMLGDDLDGERRAGIISELSRLTGLSSEYIEQTNLRIRIYRFVKELLRDRFRTTGRLDSRFTGIDEDAAGATYDYDPSYQAIYGPFSTLLNDYVRREIDFQSDLPYEIISGRVRPWNYGGMRSGYVNVAERLRDAMTKNPYLKVFVANGYYDLATPYFATLYTFKHLGLDESLRGNVSMAYYEAGHMMYIHRESLVKLKSDLAAFYAAAH